jgi:hypothetical protein
MDGLTRRGGAYSGADVRGEEIRKALTGLLRRRKDAGFGGLAERARCFWNGGQARRS